MTSRSIRRFAIAALVFPSILWSVPRAGAEIPYALTSIRVVHAVPGATGIDVALDGEVVAREIGFGEVGESATVEPGDHELTVTASGGAGTAIVEEQVRIDEGAAYIYTLFGDIGETEGRINEVNLDALPAGEARLRLINVAESAGEIDLIQTGGEEIFDRVAFDRDTAYAPVAAGPHRLELRGGDDQAQLLAEVEIDAADGLVYDLIAYEDPQAGAVAVLVVQTSASPPCSRIVGVGTPADACLRVVNAVGVDGVTVAIASGQPVGPLRRGEATGFLPVSGGEDLPIELTGVSLEADSIDLESGQAYLVVVTGGESPALILAKIDLTPLPDGQARVRLIHALDGFGDADVKVPAVDDQVLIFHDLEQADASRYRVFDAGEWQFELTGDDDQRLEPWLAIETGLVYDVVVLNGTDGPELLVVTSPAEIRGAEGSPVAADPGATPLPAAP